MKANEIEKRRAEIMALLKQKSSLKVSELVRRFAVSDETIRKDLRLLSDQGLVNKQFGKVTLIPNIPLPPVAQRTTKLQIDKQHLAQAALKLLTKPALTIALDQGSTVATLAQLLNQFNDLTIVTSSLLSLIALQNTKNVLYSTGGKYNIADMSFQGTRPSEFYEQIHVDFCFLGSSGVAGRDGFCSSSFADAEMKRTLIHNSAVSVLLLDKSKFTQSSLVQVAKWSAVDYVITNLAADSADYQFIAQQTQLISTQ